VNCPRCSNTLEERAWVSATVDICRRCGGVWLDRGELDRIIASEHDEGRAPAARGRDDDDDDDDDAWDDGPTGARRRAQGAPDRDGRGQADRGPARRGGRDDDDGDDGRQGGWLSRLSQLFD